MNEWSDKLKKVMMGTLENDADLSAATYGGPSMIMSSYFSSRGNQEMAGKNAEEQLEALRKDIDAHDENTADAYKAYLEFSSIAYQSGDYGNIDSKMVAKLLYGANDNVTEADAPDFDTYRDFASHVGGNSGVFFGIGKDTTFGAGSKLYKSLGEELKGNISDLDSKVSNCKEGAEFYGSIDEKMKESYDAAVAERDTAYVDYINGSLRENMTEMYAAEYMTNRAEFVDAMIPGHNSEVRDVYGTYAKSLLKYDMSKSSDDKSLLPTKEERDAAMEYLMNDPESAYYQKTAAEIEAAIKAENDKQLADAFSQTVIESKLDLANEIGDSTRNGQSLSNEIIAKYMKDADDKWQGKTASKESAVEVDTVEVDTSVPVASSGDYEKDSDEKETVENEQSEPVSTSGEKDEETIEETLEETEEATEEVGEEASEEAEYSDISMGDEKSDVEITGDPYSAENIAKRYELAGDDPKEIAKLDYEMAQAVWTGKIGNGEDRRKALGDNYDRIQVTVINPIADGKLSAFLQPGTDEYDKAISNLTVDSNVLDVLKDRKEATASDKSLSEMFREVAEIPEVKEMHDNLAKGTATLESIKKDLSDEKSSQRVAMAEMLGGVSSVSAEATNDLDITG